MLQLWKKKYEKGPENVELQTCYKHNTQYNPYNSSGDLVTYGPLYDYP